MGFIYILTNPSFPDYVKLGYADDAEKRLVELNRSECIPFAFRIYATYETSMRLTDLKLHALIDKLNPTLRAIDSFNGKPRKKEFYAMTKEDAFFLLQAIAEINGAVDKLKLYPISEKEVKEEMIADEITSERNLETYFENKNKEMIRVYKQMEQDIFNILEDVYQAVTTNYISWKTNGRCFAEIHLYKNSIRVQVLEPIGGSDIGEKMPENYNWTLNYRFSLDSIKDIKNIKNLIINSYNQLAKKSIDIKEDISTNMTTNVESSNKGILPDGVYTFSQKSKNTGKVVNGILEVKNGVMFMKAGSILADEEDRSEGNKHLFVGLKIENNILKEDFVIKSVSTAASLVSGRSSNGWVSWKNANGDLIDIYRKKKENE